MRNLILALSLFTGSFIIHTASVEACDSCAAHAGKDHNHDHSHKDKKEGCTKEGCKKEGCTGCGDKKAGCTKEGCKKEGCTGCGDKKEGCKKDECKKEGCKKSGCKKGGCKKSKGHKHGGIHKISLEQLVILNKAAKKGKEHFAVYDVNGNDFRKENGVIPGARFLDSSTEYDTAALPTNKDAWLVFYCSNQKCGASKKAARRAKEAGYHNLFVFEKGLMGWKEAGKKTKKFKG